jgi:hypothetical protein
LGCIALKDQVDVEEIVLETEKQWYKSVLESQVKKCV